MQHFESHLQAFREHLEVEVSRLTAAAQQLTESSGWWDNPHQVGGAGYPWLLLPERTAAAGCQHPA